MIVLGKLLKKKKKVISERYLSQKVNLIRFSTIAVLAVHFLKFNKLRSHLVKNCGNSEVPTFVEDKERKQKT